MAFIERFSKDQLLIKNLVYKFGCIQKEQIYEILKKRPPYKVDRDVLAFLCNRKHIKSINDKYYTIPDANESKLKMETIHLLWAMLKITDDVTEILNAIEANEPADYYMTKNNTAAFQIMLLNEGNFIRLRTMQEEIEQRTRRNGNNQWDCYYVLVINSKKIFDKVKEFDFKIPLSVIYIEEVKGQPIPTIRKFKRTPSET